MIPKEFFVPRVPAVATTTNWYVVRDERMIVVVVCGPAIRSSVSWPNVRRMSHTVLANGTQSAAPRPSHDVYPIPATTTTTRGFSWCPTEWDTKCLFVRKGLGGTDSVRATSHKQRQRRNCLPFQNDQTQLPPIPERPNSVYHDGPSRAVGTNSMTGNPSAVSSFQKKRQLQGTKQTTRTYIDS